MNINKATRFTALVLIAVLVLLTVGCRDRGTRKRQVGFLITLDHPYWHNMRLGAEDQGKKQQAVTTDEETYRFISHRLKLLQGFE